MPELTGPQIITYRPYKVGVAPMTNQKLRRMRRDPVINLVRMMFFAGVYSGEWSYEASSEADSAQTDHLVTFIEEEMKPIRRHLLSTAALGCFDYGWQPYEKVLEVD